MRSVIPDDRPGELGFLIRAAAKREPVAKWSGPRCAAGESPMLSGAVATGATGEPSQEYRLVVRA